MSKPNEGFHAALTPPAAASMVASQPPDRWKFALKSAKRELRIPSNVEVVSGCEIEKFSVGRLQWKK
jgi:hypothetical protein